MAADTIDITWGAVTLSHEGPYRISNITGWEEPPDGRTDDTARPNAHGSFDAPIWASSRTVTVDGYCIDPATRSQLLTDLGAALVPTGDVGTGTLSVTFAGRTLTAKARYMRSSRVLTQWGPGHFGWQAQWWCADPMRYGPPRVASTPTADSPGGLVFPLFDVTSLLGFGAAATTGRVTLTNPGTADTWPTFTVTGPLPGGFELVELATGRRLRWTRDVPDGIQVVLDARAGTVTYGGAPGYDGALTVRQWWSVPAGGSRTVQFNPLGTPNTTALMAVTWSPAYW